MQFRDAKRAADTKVFKVSAVRWVKKLGLIFFGVMALLFLFGLYIQYDAEKRTPEAVARIHTRAVTMEMVEGKNLPPMPSVAEKDATVAGVDINKNGVRDDVEIEIFNRHPNEPKVRAAQLQYAMALQSRLTDVFSEGTLVAVMQEDGRAWACLKNIYPLEEKGLPAEVPIYEWTREQLDLSNEYSKKHDALVEPFIQEVKVLVLNTEERSVAFEEKYQYMTGYGGSKKEKDCDIEL